MGNLLREFKLYYWRFKVFKMTYAEYLIATILHEEDEEFHTLSYEDQYEFLKKTIRSFNKSDFLPEFKADSEVSVRNFIKHNLDSLIDMSLDIEE